MGKVKPLPLAVAVLAVAIALSAVYVYEVMTPSSSVADIGRYGSILKYDPPRAIRELTVNSTEGPIEFPVKGKINIVTPQYVGCPDICPLESMIMHYIMEDIADLGLQDRVVFITIDVDPWRDTPEEALDYMEAHAGNLIARGIKWIWIVDEPGRMRDLWESLSIYVKRDNATGLITHTGGFFIISPDGKLLYFVSPSSQGWKEHSRIAKIIVNTILDSKMGIG